MNNLMLMTGIDVPIPALEIAIHQPTIKEISYMGELEYFSTLQFLCFDKNVIMAANPKGASSLAAMNNFQIFMTLLTQVGGDNPSAKINDLQSVFTLLLPNYTMQMLPTGLFFNNSQSKHNFTINETNFDLFRDVINKVAGISNATGGANAGFNPRSKKAAEIAAKLMKGRQKVAQARGEKSEGVLARYVSILTIGSGSMSLHECLNLTVYQLYDLMERYGLYVGWDLDIRSRLAGGKPDSKPDDWMKDLH